jgi:uncharacterized damage-inducible protein DinB
MTELEHLADTIRRSHEGEAWHGPAFAELLGDVSPEQAAKRIGDVHTIWELTEHITAWVDIIRRRMEGERLTDENISWEENYPPVPSPTAENWIAAKTRAADASRRLAERVQTFPAARLDEQVPGKDYSFAVMMHGAAQHVIYHAGQIAILKKLTADSSPA